jgi:hypothetical protein
VLSIVLVTVLSGAPTFRLAAPGFSSPNLPNKLTDYYAGHLAHQLTLEGIPVTTPEEVAAIIGVERQRQLLGCTDNGGCMVEIASALGIDALITGTIATFGSETQIDVKVISARDAHPLVTFSGRAKSEGDILEVLNHAAAAVVEQLKGKGIALGVARGAPSAEPAVRKWAWVPLAAGGVLAAAGAVSYVGAKSKYDDLVANKPGIDAPGTASSGSTLQTASFLLWACSAAAVATAATFYLWPKEREQVSATVSFSPGGVWVSGTLP